MSQDYDGRAETRAKIGISLATLIGGGASVAVFFFAMRWIRANHIDYHWAMAASAAYGVVILTISFMAVRSFRRLPGVCNSDAMKRYNRRSMIAMVFYCVAVLTVAWIKVRVAPTGASAVLMALAPSLPLLFVLGAMLAYLREETDEFQRRLMLESCLGGAFLLLALATVWGFLESFAEAPHVPSWWALPIWALGLAASRFVLARRYR